MFFALQNAIFDASIVAWHVKRLTDSVRPVTAVHFLKGGKPVRAWAGPCLGTRIIDGSQWQPYQAATVVTPPFPEYFSGHSIFSRTGAEILKAFTGSDWFGAEVTIPAGSSRVEPGAVPATDIVLSWPTFKAAADEAGISRRYGVFTSPRVMSKPLLSHQRSLLKPGQKLKAILTVAPTRSRVG